LLSVDRGSNDERRGFAVPAGVVHSQLLELNLRMFGLEIFRVLPVAIEDARFSQPRKNLACKTSRTQYCHTRLTFQVPTDQAAIRLTAEILQVKMTHLPGVNERIRS
jgi:hypothetical protein